jgi:hypothetical protein
MSGEHLSATTRALLKGARADAPGAAAKAKVWSGVSATLGGAAGAGAAGAGAAGFGTSGAGLSAAKMLVAGTLLGGALTVGLAAMLLRIGPAPSPSTTPPSVAAAFAGATVAAPDPPTPPAAPAIDAFASGAGAGANMLPGAQVTTGSSPGASPASAAHAATSAPRHGSPQHGPHPAAASAPLPSRHPSGDDALTREASLVASARAALSGGNAEEALRLVRSARSMPSPQLVPEELTVEAQALRALGKADDARGVDATLHSQYPESALAR